jgi:3-deoxy-D-manno-octulosonic acid (KDO) 8-phosphate synthase
VVNVEKGHFLAPWDMSQVVSKLTESGLEASSGRLWLTERGSSFGYSTLFTEALLNSSGSFDLAYSRGWRETNDANGA